MDKNFKPVALVTGASSGIGAATASLLAQAGYKVFGTRRQVVPGNTSAFELLPLDVTCDASADAAVAEVVRRAGRLDLLVNNAGFNLAMGGAEESSIEQAQAIFNTNFFGVLRMTRAALPHMRRQGDGRIINIGSVVGFMPMPYMALYTATKHALEGYSRSLDHELRGMGIRVCVIEPAFMKTSIEANAQPVDAPLAVYQSRREAMAQRLDELFDQAEDANVVAQTVLQAARAAHPQLGYTSGRAANGLRWMQTLLPEKWLDRGIRRHLRIH